MSGESPKSSGDMAGWFFETSRDLFCVADAATGVLTEVNPAWTRVLGWTREELLGKPPTEFLHPDDLAGMIAMTRAIAKTGEADSIARLRTREGRWLWFEGRNRVTEDGRLVGVLRDITDERERESELESSRRTWVMLREAAGIGQWDFDPTTGVISWSDDILSLFGWSQDEIGTTESFNAKLDPGQGLAVADAFAKGVFTGEGASVEHRIRTKAGRWLTMRATFRTEPRGKYFALKGISQNVTELVATRDAAIRNEARITALMDVTSDASRRLQLALTAAEAGVFEIDHANQTFWASEQFISLVGQPLTYEEAAAAVWHNTHPDDERLVLDTTQRWAAGDTQAGLEFRIVRPDGEARWVRVFYALDTGSRKGVGLVMDIDARKRQELDLIDARQAAEAASEAKARFLANMSHELRTPMNGVLGVLHLLERETTRAGQALLAEALGCGQMLTALLDDIIDFSKIEAGKLELTPEPVEIAALVGQVARLLEPQADTKGLILRVEGAAACGWVQADPVRLRQALFNLVGNAVKFTLEGHVTVRCLQPSPGMLSIEVEDSGVGIPHEAQSNLFQRFHQADASTTRQFGGSGLGLAITARLAEIMGGEIAFHSDPGVGSTFRFTVPAPPAAAAPAPLHQEDGVLDGLRILVVEDNPTNRLVATRLLETLGACVATAEDGAAGVEAARTGDHDLILMDVQMPVMDGPEAARRIRQLPGQIGQIPIIALTANVMAHQKALYLDAGMDGVVAKPLAPGALLAEIARLAGQSAEAAA